MFKSIFFMISGAMGAAMAEKEVSQRIKDVFAKDNFPGLVSLSEQLTKEFIEKNPGREFDRELMNELAVFTMKELQ